MKTYKSTLILILILGLLLGAYYGVKTYQDQKKKSQDAEVNDTPSSLYIFKEKSMDLIKLTLKNKEGEFQFEKKSDEWTCTSPSDFRVQSSQLDILAQSISNLEAVKVIEENPSDLDIYGLGSPSAVVTAVYKDNKEVSLEVGNTTPTKEGYYVKEVNKNKIYVINAYIGNRLLANKDSLRNKQLFTFKPEDITQLVMEKQTEKFLEGVKAQDETWDMTYPIKCKLNQELFVNTYTSIASLEILSFVGPDNGSYGFDKPSYSFELQTAKEKVKLLLGKEKVKSSEIYGKFEGQDEVFVISEDSLDFLDKPIKEFVESFIYMANIADVSRVVVDMDNTSVNCEINVDSSGDTSQDKFSVNGKDASMKDSSGSSVFKAYYRALISISLDSIEPSATPSGNPEISFTYYLKKNSETVKIDFVPKDNENYYVLKNGHYMGLTVSKNQFDAPGGVREAYKNLMTAMEAHK